MIGYLTQDHALIHAFRPRPARRSRREMLALNRVFKLAPKLSDYFRREEISAVRGSMDRPISGIVMDSRQVMPGTLFFALPGRRADGMTFIDEAINRGAVAVVTARLPVTTPSKVTFIQVGDPRAMLARVAQRFYKFPDREVNVVAVAGTHGKTTVAHLLHHFLSGEQRTGLLGTISYDLGGRTVPSFKSTPESLDAFGLLAQMRDAGCRQAVMEVSPHAIEQQRLLGLQIGAAVFTNLAPNSLDPQPALDSYFKTKNRLFLAADARLAVINLDDAQGARLAATLPAHLTHVTFGEDPRAMVRAEQVVFGIQHTAFTLIWPQTPGGGPVGGTNELRVEAPVIGRYNLRNLLAAIATAWALGRDPRVFLARLKGFAGVAGRMERIDAGQPFNVLVDYAHSDNTLRHALGVLRAITPGRLFVVFGCGGNRDRTQRPRMVQVVQQHADFAFATADNPRGESLEQIFGDMRAGICVADKIAWIENRRRAIGVALDGARSGDTVLIAGKGHESYQELADITVPFDDRQVARELLDCKMLRSS